MTIYIQDTFDGSGLLNTHTANTGGAWLDGFWDNTIELTGAGSVVSEVDFVSGYNTLKQAIYSVPIPVVSYFVEVDLSIPANTELNTFIGLVARYQVDPAINSTNDFVDYIWWPSTVYAGAGNGGFGIAQWGDGAYINELDIPEMFGLHTLRLEVDATESRIYIDGDLRQTTPLEPTVPLPGYVGFTINQDMNTVPGVGIAVLEFRAGDLDYIPPPKFWINLDGVTEAL